MMKRILAVVLCLLLMAPFTSLAADTNTDSGSNRIDPTDTEALFQFYKDMLTYTELWYYDDITTEEMLLSAIYELIKEDPSKIADIINKSYGALDEYSHYLSAEEYESISSDFLGKFEGVGIYYTMEQGRLLVIGVIPETPAAAALLKPGDIITHVNGTDIKGLTSGNVMQMLRGPVGSEVELTVERSGERFDVKLSRDVVRLNPITHHMIKNSDIGYIKINAFNVNTSDFFADAIIALEAEGAKRYVVDLRDNGGGLVDHAENIASYLLGPGKTITTVESKGEPEVKLATRDLKRQIKSVVLVNGNTASASEIVASAFQDNGGILVGEKTYGKGVIQRVVETRQGGAVWLTYAQYRTPAGEYIHKVGVTPKYVVENGGVDVDTSGFEKVSYTKKYAIGDKGSEVRGIKQRLQAIGFTFDEITDEYDAYTAKAITTFQSYAKLYPYGVADIATQKALDEEVAVTKVPVDLQLDKAIELVKALK